MTSKEKVLKDIQNKEAYTLNLSDSMSERIVSNATNIIGQLEASKERMFATYEEKRLFFEQVEKEWLEIKQQWDNLDAEIEEQQRIIAVMKGFRKANSPNKRLNVVKERNEHSGTRAPKRVQWLEEAAEILHQEQRFMTPEAIADRIFQKDKILELTKLMKADISTVKSACIFGFIRHAGKTESGLQRTSKIFKPVLTQYHNLIGLVEWTTDDNVPKPEFIKQFMHSH